MPISCSRAPPLSPSQSVTKAKLGYDPVEVAPEDMVRLARETPQVGAGRTVRGVLGTG